MNKCAIVVLCFCMTVLGVRSEDVEASPPQKVTLTVYDNGKALVNELRQVNLSSGENLVIIRGVPTRLDPASASFTPVSGQTGMSVLEQQFAYDLGSADQLFSRYLGKDISVSAGSGKATGKLIGIPRSADSAMGETPLVVQAEDGSAVVFLRPELLNGVTFPNAVKDAYLTPTLLWRTKTKVEGAQNLRLSFTCDGFKWWAGYEAVLAESGAEMSFSGRVGLENKSGGAIENARVKLVLTEQGMIDADRLNATKARRKEQAPSTLRYRYGDRWPTFEKAVASSAPQDVYELPRRLSLEAGQIKLTEIKQVSSMPVDRFFVYDGVKFDKYQRPRRNDWNYGTESHQTVETHLKFENVERFGLGIPLPPGLFRLYAQRDDGSLDLLGEDFMQSVKAGAPGNILLGPAKGLRGEREQVGYSEVTPLHDYEESFEIRLENHTEETVEIRVVEHLYRWAEYEVVKADLEYNEIEKQLIEFRPVLKPGGSRSIHYTVRYSW